MKVARTILSVLAVALASTAFAGAQGPGPQMGPGFAQHRPPFEKAFGGGFGNMGRLWNNPRMIERLKLTDEQRKSMDEILFAHREKLIDLQANLKKAELAMSPLMEADQPDQKAIEAQIDKIVQARGDLERANSRFLLDIRMKLTPEQWKTLREMHANHMEGRPGQMGGHRPGAGQERMWRGRPGGPGAMTPHPGNPPAGQAPAPEAPAQPQGPGE